MNHGYICQAGCFRVGLFLRKNECLCLLTLSAPNFRIHLKPAFFFLFNKLSMGKKFKVERLNVKRPRS